MFIQCFLSVPVSYSLFHSISCFIHVHVVFRRYSCVNQTVICIFFQDLGCTLWHLSSFLACCPVWIFPLTCPRIHCVSRWIWDSSDSSQPSGRRERSQKRPRSPTMSARTKWTWAPPERTGSPWRRAQSRRYWWLIDSATAHSHLTLMSNEGLCILINGDRSVGGWINVFQGWQHLAASLSRGPAFLIKTRIRFFR